MQKDDIGFVDNLYTKLGRSESFRLHRVSLTSSSVKVWNIKPRNTTGNRLFVVRKWEFVNCGTHGLRIKEIENLEDAHMRLTIVRTVIIHGEVVRMEKCIRHFQIIMSLSILMICLAIDGTRVWSHTRPTKGKDEKTENARYILLDLPDNNGCRIFRISSVYAI